MPETISFKIFGCGLLVHYYHFFNIYSRYKDLFFSFAYFTQKVNKNWQNISAKSLPCKIKTMPYRVNLGVQGKKPEFKNLMLQPPSMYIIAHCPLFGLCDKMASDYTPHNLL